VLSPLLTVEHLSVAFPSGRSLLPAVADVSFTLRRGETLGLVGESGSGKSLTALALIRLVPLPGRITGGRILLDGRDLLAASDEEIRGVRGAGIGFVFQEPMTALSPVFTIGDQVAEALVAHGRASWPEARTRAVALLDAVRIPSAAVRARDYPHQLSGGLRQRAMMAVALACDPPIVVADEPTTALDVTVQAEVLDLLDAFRRERSLGLLLITHDLGIVAGRADRIAVMYAGRIVEQGPVRAMFATPLHPYTQALLAAAPGRVPAAVEPSHAWEGAGLGEVSGGFTLPRKPGEPLVEAPSLQRGWERTPRRLPVIEGTVPSLATMPQGCAFEPRCTARMPQCRTEVPPAIAIDDAHEVACFLHPGPGDGTRNAERGTRN